MGRDGTGPIRRHVADLINAVSRQIVGAARHVRVDHDGKERKYSSKMSNFDKFLKLATDALSCCKVGRDRDSENGLGLPSFRN